MSHLSTEDFHAVRRNTPLISIDLIIEDHSNRVLMGYRTNEPAKNTWFVPGGRIRKDETLSFAFSRIILDEFGTPAILGISDDISHATFLGVYQHLYPATPTTPYSIHYVVLAYRLKSTRPTAASLPQTQHNQWRWFDTASIKSNPSIHPNTQAYF